MSKKSKELDKFYTHPKIAQQFVEIVNHYFPYPILSSNSGVE